MRLTMVKHVELPNDILLAFLFSRHLGLSVSVWDFVGILSCK